MATQQYTTAAGRINKLKGEILKHALHVECLGITGQNKKMPKNNGDTVVYRRWLPYGATSTNANTQNRPSVTANLHLITEGVTPAADTLTPVDVQVTLQQYGVLYSMTDKTVDLYEDDVPAEMKKHTGERVGLLREMIRYGALKGCTNAYYSGGTSRATVDGIISINLLGKMARNLQSNHAMPITQILSASANFNTAPVQAAYLVFCHTDLEQDIEKLDGYKNVSEYGTRKPVHPNELGSVGRFRFIISPELAPYADSGGAVAGLGLTSTTGTSADVYPVIVCGEDAWGDVALRGKESIDPTYLPPSLKDKSDPHGQRGYIGATFYSAAIMLNNGWAAVAECAVTDLVI